MALRLNDKIDRVTRFMAGLRNPAITERLGRFGFGQDDLDEGWALIRKAVVDRIDIPEYERPEPGMLKKLDDWENTWFPIARASLERRFPEAAEKVFNKLSQSSGMAVTFSVSAFITRIEALKGVHDDALALLKRRGLTKDVMGSAKEMLAYIGRINERPAIDTAALQAELEQAEENIWGWYKEWSAIARQAITEHRLLREMGFRNPKTATTPESDSDTDD